jgi:glycosyltransferase involved in cell wall biosynthesis
MVFDTSFLRIIQSSAPELRLKIVVVPTYADFPTPSSEVASSAPSRSFAPKFKENNSLSIFVPRNASLSSGTPWLLEIAQELYKLSPTLSWQMYVAGKGVSRTGAKFELSINSRLQDSRYAMIQERIYFLGYLDRTSMFEVYQMSDVILIPTFAYEGICLSVVEALSFGKPIVATNVGGLNDSIVNGFSGLLSRPTPPEIAETLFRVLIDKELRVELSTGAKSLSAMFTKEKFDMALRTTFDSIAQSGNS